LDSTRLAAIFLLIGLALPAFAQSPPGAVLGEPVPSPPTPGSNRTLPFLDPALERLRDPLGPPDQPFRPFAPLGPPPNPVCEGIGTRLGLAVLAGRFGVPGYGIAWFPSQPVTGQPTNLAELRQDLSIFAPIQTDGDDSATVGVGIRNSVFSTDAILPNSHRSFPSTLWDIEAGVAYAHRWENGWTTGAAVSVGSASNRPFSESNTLLANVALYTAFPTVGDDAWIVGVNYSPTSDFPYPFPIVAYYWKPNEDLEANIGIPFFMKWRFLPEFTANLLYVPIRTVTARVTWDPEALQGFHVYGAFDWSNESYFLANREENDQRFYHFEKRLTAGMQFDLIYRLRLDISAGYAFDRFYFQGKQYSDRNYDRVNVGSGVFGAVQLRLQF
jgi:hypothetical protein